MTERWHPKCEGKLVRVVSAGDQPLWTRHLVGGLGLVLSTRRPAATRHESWEVEVLVGGAVHVLHPLDLEWLVSNGEGDDSD